MEGIALKLKNYFQIGIGAGLAIALIASIVWVKSDYSKTGETVVTDEPQEPADSSPDSRLEEDLAARHQANASAAPAPTKKAEAIDPTKIAEAFGAGLKQMSACLNVTADVADRVEPTYANLLAFLKPAFGDPIMNSEDWVVWSLRAKGEERRIRVETDYSDSQANVKNLRYFKLDAQGTPSLIPLPTEQTRNPSEALIASLQKDGEVYQEEKGLRGYFENGQELTATERDGKIDDLEITNGPKTFHCGGILTASSNCKCF
jgi:hypothetical protein